MRGALAVAAAVLALAPAAHAGGPAMLVGAAEDQVKQPTLAAAQAKIDLLRLAGLQAVRVTSIWDPAATGPPPSEIRQLRNVAAAAKVAGVEVFLSVYNFGSRTTPLSDDDQTAFATHAAALARAVPGIRNFIIGNEPNLNRFWLPQFNPDGSDAAAPAYLSLLYRTYITLKQVDPAIRVIGGAVSPRGGDKPGGKRPTHSPTTFIRDLGIAYRASGIAGPVMDAFAFHPYPENSRIPPTFQHPRNTSIGIADYGKLVALLGEAFDGTAQRGSTLPILYAEYGVETRIPEAKAPLYSGTEPPTIKPVDEGTQAAFYREAAALAFCQPNVIGLFYFHTLDESNLHRFQSGLFYADGTPKSSLTSMNTASRAVRGGVIRRCGDLELTPKASAAFPRAPAVASGRAVIRVTCDLDCAVYARLEKLPKHSTTYAVRARGLAGEEVEVRLPARKVAPGRYRFTVRLSAPVNPGPPRLLVSRPLKIR